MNREVFYPGFFAEGRVAAINLLFFPKHATPFWPDASSAAVHLRS
jgi:hypothetical protein